MRRIKLITAMMIATIILISCNRESKNSDDDIVVTPTISVVTVTPIPTPGSINSDGDQTDIDNGAGSFDDNYNATYDLAEASYFNDDIIKIYYPQIAHLGDKELQDKINEVIKADALVYVDNFNLTGTNNLLENDYRITWKGGKLLSIQFIGYINQADTAYPTSFLYTTNINMQTGEKVKLTDLVQVNDDFIKTLNDKSTTQYLYFAKDRILSSDDSFSTPDISRSIKEYIFGGDSPTDFSKADDNKDATAFSYFTEHSLGICVATINALGDYIQLEVKYDDLQANLRKDNSLWKEFAASQNITATDGTTGTIITPGTANAAGSIIKEQIEINENEILKNINYVPGFSIIKDQSFWIDFENWGKVYFLAGVGEGDFSLNSLYLYLADNNSNILYEFPSFYGNGMMFNGIKAVAFKDANNDGIKDVIVIADYMTGVGADGAKDFPVAGVYFQQNKEFINLPEVDEELNLASQNKNIDMVLNYLIEMDINLN